MQVGQVGKTNTYRDGLQVLRKQGALSHLHPERQTKHLGKCPEDRWMLVAFTFSLSLSSPNFCFSLALISSHSQSPTPDIWSLHSGPSLSSPGMMCVVGGWVADSDHFSGFFRHLANGCICLFECRRQKILLPNRILQFQTL